MQCDTIVHKVLNYDNTNINYYYYYDLHTVDFVNYKWRVLIGCPAAL